MSLHYFATMRADEIATGHTHPGGYGDHTPPPILAGCTEPLAPGAPDMRARMELVSGSR